MEEKDTTLDDLTTDDKNYDPEEDPFVLDLVTPKEQSENETAAAATSRSSSNPPPRSASP